MTTYPTHLFVYGTLLAQSDHPMGRLLSAHADVVSDGTIQARLYIITEEDAQGINRYPGAVPSPFAEDVVHGVLHKVRDPEAVFPAFDDFEACAPGWPEPYEFLLRPIDVTQTDGTVIRASAYIYTWDTARAEHVPSGRFVENASKAR